MAAENKVSSSTFHWEWAPRKDIVFLTAKLSDATDLKHNIKPDSLEISGKDLDNKEHKAVLYFYKEIVPGESTHKKVAQNYTQFILKRKEEGEYWPQLLTTKKNQFLKTDFSKWKDEDVSDDDVRNNFGLGGGMPGLGGMDFGDIGNLPDNEAEDADSDDSDNEDIPGLDENVANKTETTTEPEVPETQNDELMAT